MADVEQKVFDEIERIVACDTLLIYPYFNKRFVIHTNDSDLQLGSVIIQYGKPIALYSRKLIGLQTCCTVTEKLLLCIVKTLKTFCTILLCQ